MKIKIDDEAREEISQKLLAYFELEEGAGFDNPEAQRQAFLGIRKRIPELAEKTGISSADLELFCWELVAAMVKPDEAVN